MARDAQLGESGKKVLVVGQLGYHEENIIKPILKGLEERGCSITRMGGNWDFFIPANYPQMTQNYISGVPNSLEAYDIVFFVDYWNMVMPLFVYLRSICSHRVPFVGLYHGSVALDSDVAQLIEYHREYEAYLWTVFDEVLVPENCNTLRHYSAMTKVPFPCSLQFSRERPKLPHKDRVIFAHRFSDDKGKDEFTGFVDYCQDAGLSVEFIVTDEGWYPGVEFIGRLSQDELKKLCSQGGYAWSSAKQETFGYTILDLMSYGLTPLVNYAYAYNYLSRDYRYLTYREAAHIIKNKVVFSNQEWDELNEKMNRIDRVIDVILGAL